LSAVAFNPSAPSVSPTPIIHKAPWPKALDPSLKSLCTKTWEVFCKILSFILFPIALIQCGIRWLRSYIFSIAILPGCRGIDPSILEAYEHDFFEEFPNAQPVTLTAPDDVTVKGVFIPGTSPNKAIIYGFGNGGQWEVLDEDKIRLLLSTGASLLMINPRTVGKSDKVIPDEQGLSLDYWAAYHYLMQQGLDPEKDIVALGQSMGGALTCLGAAVVQEEYPEKKIGFISLRSFSTLTQEIQEILAPIPPNAFCGLGRFVPCLASRGAKAIGMEIDAAKAFDKLKGEKYIFSIPTDKVIPEAAQLQNGVSTPFNFIQMHSGDPDHDHNAHNRPFCPTEETILVARIEQLLHLAPRNIGTEPVKIHREKGWPA
jgi:pimeloyl-ACP methyl ester carboxylesterase